MVILLKTVNTYRRHYSSETIVALVKLSYPNDNSIKQDGFYYPPLQVRKLRPVMVRLLAQGHKTLKTYRLAVYLAVHKLYSQSRSVPVGMQLYSAL